MWSTGPFSYFWLTNGKEREREIERERVVKKKGSEVVSEGVGRM